MAGAVSSDSLVALGNIVVGLFVFLMQVGFILLEAGACRTSNSTNIVLKNFLDTAVGLIMYWLTGFGIGFGTSEGGLIGSDGYLLINSQRSETFFFLSFFTAVTAATIPSGAMAERTNILSYLALSSMNMALVVPFVIHWTWQEDGWLYDLGARDFAGSAVIHISGGTAALVGAYLLGPRIGRFDGREKSLEGHSTVLYAFGAALIWIGFVAFNISPVSGFSDVTKMGRVAVNTMLSSCTAGLVGLMINLLLCKRWSLVVFGNCIISGCVAICAGCDTVYNWGAIVIGAVSGVVYLYSAALFEKCKLDDPLNAVSVHLVSGIWGCVSSGLFSQNDGVIRGKGTLLGVNILLCVVTIAWCGMFTYAVLSTMAKFGLLRVSEKAELSGLDLFIHGEYSYPEFVKMRVEMDAIHVERSNTNEVNIVADSELRMRSFARGAHSSVSNNHANTTGTDSSVSFIDEGYM
eukprot:Nk52_evm4s1401 gene=Nk52_evmTU4s1401